MIKGVIKYDVCNSDSRLCPAYQRCRFFVDGSSAAAKLFKIPPLIIGLTVVSMGTSLPEASVSISAALAGKNELAVSNAVGSNIFNLMVVCGVCAAICPLAINKDTLK